MQKITKSVLTQTQIKPKMHKHQTQNFRRISPFGIAPVKKKKKLIRLGHAGIVDHSVDLSIPDFREHIKKKEEMDRSIKSLSELLV